MSKRNPTSVEQAYIRRNIVIDLIRERGVNNQLKLTEIQKACAYTSSGAASTLVQSMEQDGWITVVRERDPVTGRKRNSFTIHEDKIKPVPQAQRRKPTAIVTPELSVTETTQPRINSSEMLAVRNLVLEYYWNQQNDSLRQFVAWIENKAV